MAHVAFAIYAGKLNCRLEAANGPDEDSPC